MKTRDALRDHARSLCFLLAAIIVLILSQQTILHSIHPIGDGQGYAMRAFALYGYLHAGQWSNFWNLLSRPNQSVLPLHYLLFFLLPTKLAGAATYVLALNLTTYLLLAAAVCRLCRALSRVEWAPEVFLLCSVNNVALTDYYFFYLDMEFFALGVYVIALQLSAWRDHKVSDGILSGLGLGLLFWMKPANALIFLVVYILSEIFRTSHDLLLNKTVTDRRRSIIEFLRRWGCQAIGFIPVLGAALYCGGAQAILQLIHNNEINDTTTPLQYKGLVLRLLYFPLCLSFFYHVLALGALLLIGYFVCKFRKLTDSQIPENFPSRLFLPLAAAYLVWGLFFSFVIQAKGMRSLLPMLPLCWIALFWLFEKRRLPIGFMFLVAGAYTSLAFLQKTNDLLGSRNSYVDDTYQLSLESWTQMPSPWWFGAVDINTTIGDDLERYLPPPGIICTNTIELQKELAWRLCADDLLRGRQPRYDVRLIFDYKGTYYNRTFVGADLIVFETMGVEANTIDNVESLDLLQYGINEWATREHCAQPGVLNSWKEEPLGYFFLFPKPLTQAQVDLASKSKPLSDMAQQDSDGSVPLTGPHFSRAEAWELIKDVVARKLGSSGEK